MKNISMLLISLVLLSILYSNIAMAEEMNETIGSISLGAEFTTGKYNGVNEINTLYLPLIITYFPSERIDVSAEIPFLYQSSSNVTTSLYQNSAAKISAKGGPGGMQGGYSSYYSSQSNAVATSNYIYGDSVSSSVSGVGDIVLKAGYIAFFEVEKMPQIRFSTYIKIPTADSDEGLGTGKADYGAGFDLFKTVGNYSFGGEAIYNIQGRVDQYALKNYISWNISTAYIVNRLIKPSIILKGGTQPSDYSDDLLEARVRAELSISDKRRVDLFVSKGISESSPDYGAGISFQYLF